MNQLLPQSPSIHVDIYLEPFLLDASLYTVDTNRCSYHLVSYSSAIKRAKCVYHTVVGFKESLTAKSMRHVRQVLVIFVLFTCLLCRLSYHIQPFFLINSAIGMMLAWSVYCGSDRTSNMQKN
jgi:hypothetical protein